MTSAINRATSGVLLAMLGVGCTVQTGSAENEDNELTISSATPCCDYEVAPLSGVPHGSSARAINGRGQVVGNTTTDGSAWRAFLWDAGTVTDLGTLGGEYTFAYDINESGVIVGVSETLEGERVPFLWRNGAMAALIESGEDPTIWRSGEAYAVNDNESEQVVGVRYGNFGETQAFSWQNGVFTNLTPPEDGVWTRSVAWDVNGNGTIVGEVGNDNGFAAARWQGDDLTLLDASGAATSEAALAVNAWGDAVGRITDTELGRRAASWSDGQVSYLPLDGAIATSVNDSGMIVGRFGMSASERRGFVFADGQTYNLEAVTDGNPYANTEAVDIDDRGRIVGNGFLTGTDWSASEAVLWTLVTGE